MIPYHRGLILDNTNNIGIVKTETVFGFAPTSRDVDGNSSETLEWIITRENYAPRSWQVTNPEELRDLKPSPITNKIPQQRSKKTKKTNRKAKGKKKCLHRVVKSGKKNRRHRNKLAKMQKKYLMPLILGLLAAKSLLIPVALKALAFMSAKGLIMGFVSTVMASVLSLKGMFDHHSYQNRKDDTKTQVEIIQVPAKSEDHIYYDEHYKRRDLMPTFTGGT